MADDIDIEEHDVLESLRRRRAPDDAAPDVVVKSEPLEIDYEDPNYEDQGNLDHQWEWDKNQAPEIKVEPCTEEEFRFGKIILGSKPAEPPENQEVPSTSRDETENYNYNMSLVLDDWGPMLERSDCYCKSCEILFATVNALDAHKMIAHSFLVATDKQPSPERNKAVKSTAKPSTNDDDKQTCQICHYYFKGTAGRSNLMRHYSRIHKVDPSTVDSDKDFKSWRLCNHCNMYFPDDTSLVKHLYELLPINNKTPTKDDKKPAQNTVNAKPALNNEQSNTKLNKDVKVTNVIASSKDKDKVPMPNRIILGSKPAIATSGSVSKEKIRKWACEVCGNEYCRKYYLIHMKKCHPNFLVKKLRRTNRLDRKQPETNLLNNTRIRYRCDVCSEVLTSYSAVRKHRLEHPETKGSKIFTKLVIHNKVHKVNVKPNLIKKEAVKAPSPKTVAKVNVKKEPMEENTGILVSKSTLFKCNRCSVHFLTCTGACQHSIVCETSSNIRDWACPKCQRVFKSAEKTAHEYQHQVMKSNKLKVYVVYLEMIVRILCECPKCFICFEEDKFARHISGHCHDAASYYCNECKLPIDIHSKTNHDSKHKQGDFKREDFIKIDYVSSKPGFTQKKITKELVEETSSPVKNIKVEVDEPKRSLKRKLDVSNPHKKKRPKMSNELHLYYCSACKSCLGIKLGFHVKGKCKEGECTTRKLCKFCGIYFRSTYYISHMRLHERNPNLTVSDFTFTRISDSKKIKPPPELHPCKTCKIHFMMKAARFSHKCGHTPYTHCQVCQRKIQKDTFKLHMQIHNYVIPKKIKSIDEVDSNSSTSTSWLKNYRLKEPSPPMTQLPDLMMKYESLTALWNIVYLCATCDTFTDSYDQVVEHCQNHLTNMENYGVVIVKCPKCDMKFDSDCYKRHLKLHSGNKVINKKTFQVLKYNYNDLFTHKWFDFLELPEEQKSQILSRSIYGATRSVKMRLIQQGPPEYTLYKCSKCLNCVAADTIVYHVKLARCVKANRIACSVCEMTFTMRSQCEEHENVHQTTGLGIQSFRIVAFNNEADVESNTKIMSYDAENHGSKSRIAFTDTDEEASKTTHMGQDNTSGKLKSFVLYKCNECHSSILHIRNFARHTCNKNSPKKVCEQCGVLISVKHYSGHVRLHRKYAFSRKNVITKTLNKDGKVINIKKLSQEKIAGSNQATLNDAPQKPSLYKCYCGLHYTSLKAIEKHYKMKNCSTIVREKCSQCNLVFDPIEVVNHLCKHHAQKHVNTFNIITPNKKTLYKCGRCHVLFYNKAIAVPHKAKCTGKYYGKKCEKCGLAFDATSLDMHMIDHKRNNKLQTDCYVIVTIPDENIDYTNVKLDEMISPHVLYKCTCCDIHFLRRTSARNHVVKNVNCHLQLTQVCELCNLTFSKRSIPKHVGWQHNVMKVKEFKIIELAVGMNTSIPKEDRSEAAMMPKVIKQEKAVIPKAEPVNVTLYRCIKCMAHFTDENGLVNHLEDRCSKELTEECEDCAVKFASRNIKEHRKQHRRGITLTLDIIEDAEKSPTRDHVKTEKCNLYEPKQREYSLDRYDNKLFKCTECNFHYNAYRTLEKHQPVCNPNAEGLICEACGFGWFTKISLYRHRLIHKKYNFAKDDFVIMTLDDKNIVTDESQDDVETNQKNEDTDMSLDSSFVSTAKCSVYDGKLRRSLADNHGNKLFRCADCNFLYNIHNTLVKHNCRHRRLSCTSGTEGLICEACDIGWFTKASLQRHQLLHEKYNFGKDDFVILTCTAGGDFLEEEAQGDVETQQEIEDPDISLDSTFVRTSKRRVYERRPKESSPNKPGNQLFRCTDCNFHYNVHNTLAKHRDVCNPAAEGLKCEACGIGWFTKFSLQRHLLIHEKYNYTKDDFVILTLTGEAELSLTAELNQGDEARQEIKHDSEVSQDPSFEVESTEKSNAGKSVEKKKEGAVLYLFKCAECNVYYGTQKICQKHIAKHTPLDPKEYIECKLCGFQFTIMGLQPHIKKYHEKPFNLEEILVEEYQPNDIVASETYYASEKDQSRLVSTSDDVKNVSNIEQVNDCEVSSCNEIAEKADSTDNDQVNTHVKDDETNVKDEPTNDLEEITQPSVSEVTSENVNSGQDTELL